MKKTKAAAKAPRNKVKTVDEYFSAVPEPAHTTLQKVRTAIRSVVPKEATETISYGIPAFKHKQVVIWFAAFANHCSLFPTAAVIDQFRTELKPYAQPKGTIQFPIDKPLPTTLVKKLIKARLAQIERKR